MIHLKFKKMRWPELPKADPSFYKHFHEAWTNFQENELEARLQTILLRPKTEKPRASKAI